MYTLKDIREELKTKERTIYDLTRFIQTRTDDNPNYSLLLGAGCSISSGIRSATELIESWKKEISQEYAIKLEEIERESWFNSRNSYSSLFEKKYDLPRQRRMFVEQEVRDKLPSIGYAYLVKLVESNYFKTIFTTNFDDLLNEAFYQYSTHRPIVCAHDSGINSITVTSKRPKIVKLHGDYLFDDIKSTLRETESLEENIKNKFTEFAKDYGLIVVGYGGNDRSVVDVITYLLKNEEYFKHGIYWCLMEDSIINDDLKKLLWKDRVFYVKIDGFDEVFAELNHKLNKGRLPVDNDFLNNRKKELLIKLTSNEFLKNSKCNILTNDFKNIGKNLEIDVVQNFIKYMAEKETKEKFKKNNFKLKGLKYTLSHEEEIILSEILSDIISENYSTTLQTIELKLSSAIKGSMYFQELIKLKARCFRFLKKDNEAIKCYECLINNEDNYNYYILLSKMYKEFEDKILVLDQAINAFKYNYEAYYEKAKILFERYERSLIKSEKELKFSLDELLALVNTSIALNPSIDNDSWTLKFDIINEMNTNNTESMTQEMEKLINLYEKQDINHPNLIIMKTKYMEIKEQEKELIYNTISSSIENTNELDYMKINEFTLLQQYGKYNDLELLTERFKVIEDKYEVDDDYLLLKSELLLKKYDNLKDSIEILEKIKFKNPEIYATLFEYYLYDNQIDKAKKVFEKYLPNDISLKIDLLEKEGNYGQIIEILEPIVEKKGYLTDVVHLIYCQLKAKNYTCAKNLAFKYLNKCSFNNTEILVNYVLAMKMENKLTEKERRKVKEKIIDSVKNNMQLAAAYAVLDDEDNTYKHLKMAIQEDYRKKYYSRNWVVFEDFMKESKFKKLYD